MERNFRNFHHSYNRQMIEWIHLKKFSFRRILMEITKISFNYSVHHGSPHAPQQNGELQVCNIAVIWIIERNFRNLHKNPPEAEFFKWIHSIICLLTPPLSYEWWKLRKFLSISDWGLSSHLKFVQFVQFV